ncbi:hypothetical protein ID866_4129 [Astraeus odoratus]|nr:hypothetical protein ID866_4129 [Astraeus odoratus]
MGPEITGDTVTGLDVLRHEAEQRTNAAAAHGQQDIEKAKEVGAGYVEQAKSVAGNVITSANNTLRGSSEGKPRPQGSSTGTSAPGPSAGLGGVTTDVLTSLQTTASSAIGVTQQYLSSAQAVVQPHIDSAREKAQGYLGVGMKGSESDAVTPPERSSTNMISDAQGLPGSYREPGARPSTTKVASSDPEH